MTEAEAQVETKAPAASDDGVLVRVEHLVKHFPITAASSFRGRSAPCAVDDISFEVARRDLWPGRRVRVR
jgi:ABC-type glutathione transport system ATPase component